MKAILTIVMIGAFGGYALADASKPVTLSSPVASAAIASVQPVG